MHIAKLILKFALLVFGWGCTLVARKDFMDDGHETPLVIIGLAALLVAVYL